MNELTSTVRRSLTGARRLVPALLMAALSAATLRAQTAPATSAPASPEAQDQIVHMAQFQVQTTQGMGYNDVDSATAFKTAQPLLDIPQSMQVLTNDFINDTGAVELSDILQYVGVSDFFRGESEMLRGYRIGYAYIDDMLDSMPYEDNFFVDSIEVIQGPAMVLYPGASLGGVVLKMTKKPLGVTQDTLGISVDDNGLYRATADFTGPAGSLGAVGVNYRFEMVEQQGDPYFKNDRDDVTAIHPSLDFHYNNTDVMVAYDFQKIVLPPQSDGVLLQNGDLYNGAGRQWEGGWAPNQLETDERQGMRLIATQTLGPGWTAKLTAQDWHFDRFGGNALITNANYQTDMLTYILRQNNISIDTFIVDGDVLGNYNIGSIPCQSAFGFSYSDQDMIQELWRTSTPTQYLIPMNNPAAIEAMYVPQQNSGNYPAPANPGTRYLTYSDDVYFQQEVDVVPNWVSLIAGFTYSQIENVTDTNIGVSPYTATDVYGAAWLRRLAAVFHVTKDVSVYGLESTTYSPGSSPTYTGGQLPNVNGKDDEVGLKTALWGGRLSTDFAVYKMELTNQAVLGPGLNPSGSGYYEPIGSTNLRGWNAEANLELLPRWQLVATAYKGTVRNQLNQPISGTFENSWSLFTRYDFEPKSALGGLSIGGGISRIGARWLTGADTTFAANYPVPYLDLIKVHEGTPVTLFAAYQIDKHWSCRVNVSNLLDEQFPLGAQASTIVDPAPPRTITFSVNYKL